MYTPALTTRTRGGNALVIPDSVRDTMHKMDLLYLWGETNEQREIRITEQIQRRLIRLYGNPNPPDYMQPPITSQ